MRAARLGLSASLSCLLAATPSSAEGPARLDLRLRQNLALELDDARVQKLEVEALPRLETMLPGSVELTGILRARVEAMDELEPGRPDDSSYFPASGRLLAGDVAELELRELYVERSFARAHLTLGKQQVVWGRADGIKLLDVVNPQNYREFILEPFEDSRIPLWTVNVEIPLSPLSLQLLWVPDNSVHDLPEPGASFEFRSRALVPVNPTTLPVVYRNADRPSDFFEDSDAGMRLAGSWRGWDLTLNYLYHYDDVPLPVRAFEADSSGLRIVLTPEYERTHVIGTSFATSFGSFTFRGEAAAFTDRFVATNDVFDADGILRSEEYSWLFGLDSFALGPGSFLSAQVLQSLVPGLPALAVREELQSIGTLFWRQHFLDDAAVAQAMLLMDLARGDGLLRARLGYAVSDGVTVAVGTDLFFGRSSGIFGEFGERDRLVLEIEEHL